MTYRYLIGGGLAPTAASIAEYGGLDEAEVSAALRRLAAEHVLALTPDEKGVAMAHPFSGVETRYQAAVGDRSWHANCAWDALAILALIGDGTVVGTHLEPDLVWRVVDGRVTPNGVVHMVVPASRFWENVGFT